MKLTPGKLAGLKAVSDAQGIITATAMDHRGPLQEMLTKERGGTVDDADLAEFKSIVTDVLTEYSSAILLDPVIGLSAARFRKKAGLLLAYERTGYYNPSVPGRLPELLDGCSVRRLKEAGADCIKFLLYYTPLAEASINELKHSWIERIGDECIANDIPFFLELMGYDVDECDPKSLGYAKKKPQIVIGAMTEFGKARYGIDVMKVEIPVEMNYVLGTQAFNGEAAYTQSEALKHFREADSATDKPFIYLSANVSNAVFIESLELAVGSGTRFSGVLCGRAIWKDGIPIYAKYGATAFQEWLRSSGVENIRNIKRVIQGACSWHLKP